MGIFKNKGEENKQSVIKKVIPKAILTICIIVLIVSIVYIGQYLYEIWSLKNANKELVDIYSNSPSSSQTDESGDTQMLDKFKDLYAINSDIIGWIEIPDTTINYPVVQTTDNSYYLGHNFKKEEEKAGTIFEDYRVNFVEEGLPDKTVLYGHNMESGDFFGNLHKFRELDFLKEHPVIQFDTLYDEQKWKIFACFLTNVEPSHDNGVVFDYHNNLYLPTEADFNNFYDNVMKRNFYKTDVDVKFGDDFLVLSTCSYEFYNNRFVVVARKVRDGEDDTVNTEAISENPEKYMPLAWYEVTGQKSPR